MRLDVSLLLCEQLLFRGARGYRFVLKLATIWWEKEILSSLFPSVRYDVPSEQERDTINCVEYE